MECEQLLQGLLGMVKELERVTLDTLDEGRLYCDNLQAKDLGIKTDPPSDVQRSGSGLNGTGPSGGNGGIRGGRVVTVLG